MHMCLSSLTAQVLQSQGQLQMEGARTEHFLSIWCCCQVNGRGAGPQRLPELCWPAWSCFPLIFRGSRPRKHIWQALSGTELRGAGPSAGLQPPLRGDRGTRRLFLTVTPGASERLHRACNIILCQVEDLQTGWHVPTQVCCPRPAPMACDFRTMRTHAPLCDVHLEKFPDHASALWFTPCRVRLTHRKASESISGGWAGFPPPNPCLFLILRNNRGCSHLPKTPSPGKKKKKKAGGGGQAASWLNKAETPVCQRPADGDRSIRSGRFPRSLGWETHTRAKGSPDPHSSHLLAILLLTFLALALRLSTQGWTYSAKNNLVILKGPKGSYISGGISVHYWPGLFWSGLEGHPDKAIPYAGLTGPLP